MIEEQLLYWKKAMFPEIEEKDKEIERLKELIKTLYFREDKYTFKEFTEEQIDLLNNIVFGNDEEDLGSDKE